jgi:hypothetical protein
MPTSPGRSSRARSMDHSTTQAPTDLPVFVKYFALSHPGRR